ncbi:neutral/alkaline ceramidase-like enzyme [Melghirimyces profundicolus]|uniref:Neutral/alkaline ceramidase-like enzyme n=1 Tax=Melghirimyces profundicolus TaxID=1242148 RepID=A0A2T6C0I9_9BACL|nr:neutral/alkaline non-lysosomal ceramidase N-terminal domain-containing protein [Melghirimyces profundicolus]PTX61835.1 neutral/alkaline ceramidase-like enzyme [Melghirimyces profundicolus]
MKPHLSLGAVKVDITPEQPVPLAGFQERRGSFQGVAHPLQARILAFEYRSLDRRTERGLLLSADLIWWDTKHVQRLRKRLSQQWKIPESSQILHATHTHCSPQTSDGFTPSLGEFHPATLSHLEEKIFDGIEEAFGEMEAVCIYRGFGECGIGIHRRKLVDGKVRMVPHPEGPADPEVNVIRFCTEGGKPKALLIHYTCHPTTTDENVVSSEFPGAAMNEIEERVGDGVVAAFLQGCCGDIRPALFRDGTFHRGTVQDVDSLGQALAEEVMKVFAQPMKELSPVPLRSRTLRLNLPFGRLPSLEELKEKSRRPGMEGEWSRHLLAHPERIRPHLPFELTHMEMAEGFSLLAMNGEVVVEYGLMIKERFQGRVLPVPYSNGMIGYIPTAAQTEEGGYEAEESTFYFGLPASFSQLLEERIEEALLKWIDGGQGGGH